MDTQFKVGDLVRTSISSYALNPIGTVLWVSLLGTTGLCYYVRFTNYLRAWIGDCYLEPVPEEEAALYVLGSNS